MDWHYLVELSVQYYAAGRFAALDRLYRVAPNLHHHAIELLLKAALIDHESLESVKRKYGHDLVRLWQAVTEGSPMLKTPERDHTIEELDRFEQLRYPDKLVSQGTAVTWSIAGDSPVSHGPGTPPELVYNFNLEDIDELYSTLFAHIQANPLVFVQTLTANTRATLSATNRHPIASWVGQKG